MTSPPLGAGHGTYDVFESHKWFSIDQGYALVKMKMTDSFYRDDVLSNEVIKTYDASFVPSEEFPDVWILKSVHQYEREYDEQELTIDFEAVHLGVDVPDMLFNYDGLGVPLGAPIVDSREPGPASVSYYLPGVHVGLDSIDLAAGMVAPSEVKGTRCPTAESNEEPSTPLASPPVPPAPPSDTPDASKSTVTYVLVGAFVMAVAVLLGGFRFLRRK